MILVLYHSERNELSLYDGSKDIYWRGIPWMIWNNLMIGQHHGWEVIGEL